MQKLMSKNCPRGFAITVEIAYIALPIGVKITVIRTFS